MRSFNQYLWEEGLKTALIESSSEAEDSLIDVIATRTTSDKPSEEYIWLSDAFAMEVMRDELTYRGLTDLKYTVTNSTHAIGLAVHKDHVSDDKLGLIMRRVGDMLDVALNFPNKLLITALVNGTSLNSFDGVSFFNNAHPARGLGAAFDNLLAGDGITVDNIRTDVSEILSVAGAITNEAGEPFPSSRRKWVFVVPFGLQFVFEEALNAQFLAGLSSNVRFRKLQIEVVASARLTDTNDWYAFDVSRPKRKGLIYQEHTPVTPSHLGPGSDHYFKFNEHLWKVEWRGGTGYNHPALAFKVVNA